MRQIAQEPERLPDAEPLDSPVQVVFAEGASDLVTATGEFDFQTVHAERDLLGQHAQAWLRLCLTMTVRLPGQQVELHDMPCRSTNGSVDKDITLEP